MTSVGAELTELMEQDKETEPLIAERLAKRSQKVAQRATDEANVETAADAEMSDDRVPTAVEQADPAQDGPGSIMEDADGGPVGSDPRQLGGCEDALSAAVGDGHDLGEHGPRVNHAQHSKPLLFVIRPI